MIFSELTTYWKYAVYGSYLDIRMKYSGSYIGPLWSTISLFIFAILLHSVTKTFFAEGGSATISINYIISGLLFWYYFSFVVIESCSLYSDNSILLKESTLVPIALNLRLVFKNLVTSLHNYVGFFVVWVFYREFEPLQMLFALLLIILFTIPLLFISIAVSLACARFTDLKSVIGLSMQVLFFLTPVFWIPARDTLLVQSIPYNLTAVMIMLTSMIDIIGYIEIFIVHTFIYFLVSLLMLKILKNKLVFYL